MTDFVEVLLQLAIDARGKLIWPENLTIDGYLDLRRTAVTALPDNLTVKGGLYLSHSAIEMLPESLAVGGDLDLSFTKIASLPATLSIGGNLDLSHSAITVLPECVSVGGKVLGLTATAELESRPSFSQRLREDPATLSPSAKPLKRPRGKTPSHDIEM